MKLATFTAAAACLLAAAAMTPRDASAASGPASGCYALVPQSHTDRDVAVQNSANAGGAAVITEKTGGGPAESWRLAQQPDGSYKLYAFSAANSLQMLDLPSGNAVVTGEDDAVDGKSDTTQRWWLVPVGSSYRLIPYAGGQAGTSAVTAGSTTGSSLTVTAYSGKTSQLFALKPVAAPALLKNAKKGIPTGSASLDTGASALHCSWTYNWSLTKDSNLPSSILFVPMVWGWSGDTNIGNEVMQQNPATRFVLGYNEPDEPNSVGGSNMTVATALQGFQYISALKSKGLTIGGPACAVDTDDWMSSFMSQATTSPYNYNLDFIGFHDYPGESNPYDAAYGYLGFLDAVYKQYNLPIWATEFAPTSLSPADALTFIRIVCQGLQSRSYVVRYSMFTSEQPASSGMGDSALVNSDGTLTPAGQLYARM